MEMIKKYANTIAAFLLGLMFLLAVGSMYEDAAIRDEMPHIVAGYSYLTKADYRLNPEHPPLVKQLSAVPLLFMDLNFPSDDPGWTEKVNDQWALGDTFLYRMGNNADAMIFWGRIPIVILMILAGLIVYIWAAEIFRNKAAGLIALALYAFSPNIIAHGRFITTDMGVAAFSIFALYAWWKFLKEPSWMKFSIAALLQGCLHLAKFSSPLFLPILGMMTIFAMLANEHKWDWSKRLKIYLGGICAATIIAFLMVGGWYQIFMHQMPLPVQQDLIVDSVNDQMFKGMGLQTKLLKLSEIGLLRPYVQYALGFFMVAAHASYGHDTYFLGEVGQNWPEYYFIAYLLKEPLAAQILFYAMMIFSAVSALYFVLAKQKKKQWKQWFKKYWVLPAFMLLILLFLIMGMKAKLQLGIRYVVSIFPYLYILIGGFVATRMDWLRKNNEGMFRGATVVLSLLMLWLVWANFKTYPFYLPYYNELIGGPQNGWRFMVDSNTDWGQDLRRLKRWADENGVDYMKIDYFGGGNLDYYFGEGNYETWGFDRGPTTGWLAVSIDAIQWNSDNPEEEGNYHWLTDNYEPVAQIGYSIFVYHLE